MNYLEDVDFRLLLVSILAKTDAGLVRDYLHAVLLSKIVLLVVDVSHLGLKICYARQAPLLIVSEGYQGLASWSRWFLFLFRLPPFFNCHFFRSFIYSRLYLSDDGSRRVNWSRVCLV